MEGLIVKIIRKRLEDPSRAITVDNYRNEVTDLVGVRVLHHFKRDWFPIHKFIVTRWFPLHEQPRAYVREGDSPTLREQFRAAGLQDHVHPSHYRSLHYLINHPFDRSRSVIVEIQVRTVFEEAWSEIDHRLRYPQGVKSLATIEALDFFNRVAGTSDEMASIIADQYQAWEQSAGKANAKRTDLNIADIAVLSRILGMKPAQLQRAFATGSSSRDQDTLDEKYAGGRAAEIHRMAAVTGHAMRTYYPSEDGPLVRYAVTVDGDVVDGSIFTSPERVGLSMDVNSLDNDWSPELDRIQEHPVGLAEYAVKVIKNLRDRGVRFWNAPVYRLIEATFEGPFRLRFSGSNYFSYRFVLGLLEDELNDACTAWPSEIAAHLPLRDKLLPKPASLTYFDGPVVSGGIAALCAFRRANENDFVILLSSRSAEVADRRGWLSVVPKAVHQPGVGDFPKEVHLYSTILREVYEEVFAGKDAEHLHDPDLRPDWFCAKCPGVSDIRDGKYGAAIRATAFGMDSNHGNYTLAVLILTTDAGYWERHRSEINPMWEHEEERAKQRFLEVSSRDQTTLREILTRPSWSGDALFACVEGLLELQRHYPDLVSLPEIKRCFPSIAQS